MVEIATNQIGVFLFPLQLFWSEKLMYEDTALVFQVAGSLNAEIPIWRSFEEFCVVYCCGMCVVVL